MKLFDNLTIDYSENLQNVLHCKFFIVLSQTQGLLQFHCKGSDFESSFFTENISVKKILRVSKPEVDFLPNIWRVPLVDDRASE